MQELIERLEELTEPDRELGNCVLLECGWKIDEVGDGPDRKLLWIGPDEEYLDGDQPDPTRSIDAALLLVPENAGLQLERYWLRRAEPGWRATLYTGGVPGKPARQFMGEDAYGPAIALSIAALKARAAYGGRGRS